MLGRAQVVSLERSTLLVHRLTDETVAPTPQSFEWQKRPGWHGSCYSGPMRLDRQAGACWSRRRVSTESWGHAWWTVEQPGGEAETREPKAAPRLLHSGPGQESNLRPAEATCDDNPSGSATSDRSTFVSPARRHAGTRRAYRQRLRELVVAPRALALPATTRVGLELGRQVPPRVIAQLEVLDVREHGGNVRVRLRARLIHVEVRSAERRQRLESRERVRGSDLLGEIDRLDLMWYRPTTAHEMSQDDLSKGEQKARVQPGSLLNLVPREGFSWNPASL
jgi:hypothetical protein